MVIYVLLLAHIGGDFFIQSDRMVKMKLKQPSAHIYHSLLYAGLFLAALLFSVKITDGILPFLILAVSHFLLDYIKIEIEKRVSTRFSFLLFIVDQISHIAIIFCVYTVFELVEKTGSVLLRISDLLGSDKVHNFLIYLFIYMIMLKPLSVTIRKLLEHIDVNGGSESGNECEKDIEVTTVSVMRAGSYIGMLERVITITLILQEQWGAVGFVLAAKSLARFRQLENKEFAEKYLIGTLSSLASAIFFALLFTNWIN